MINSANIIREKRKTIKIIINNNGELSVFCPLNLSYAKISEILKSKEKLLTKKISKIKSTGNKFCDVMNFKKLLLLGKEYSIVPVEKTGKGYFTDDSFLMPIKYYDINKTAYIKKILKEFAEKIIVNRVEELAEVDEKFVYSKVLIGNFRSKWGSCDSESVLKFNWKLVMVGPKVIDFVILHELTHLKELNHSAQFYNNLEKLCPNWKFFRKQLKEYSFLLELYN